MKKTVHIIGNKGNMGRRYAAILRYLDMVVTGHDVDEQPNLALMNKADCFIIASATETHIAEFKKLALFGVPILCEKPLTKKIHDLDVLEKRSLSDLDLFTLVNQYAHLVDRDDVGETYWDFYNSGKDGLYWDCINIIGLSKSRPTISNTSPIWSAKINGKKLYLGQMDNAYIDMIESWLENPISNWHYTRIAHEKTTKLINGRW